MATDGPTEDVAASRTPATAATLTSATTSFVTWAVGHYGFHGSIPPEVFGFMQLVVPAGMGWAGAWITRRRQECARERQNPPR